MIGFLEPIGVELRKEAHELRIEWSDDHESIYPLQYLRGYCPCASCQGHGGAWEYVPNDGPELAAIEEVGNYAYNLIWADKHETGIYAFELLRDLCPCDACLQAAGDRHPYARMPK